MPRPKLVPPAGYDEGGKVLAEAVIQANQPKRWAADLAGLLGYSKSDLDAWIAWYNRINRNALRRSAERSKRKQAKLDAIRNKIQELESPELDSTGE